MRVSAHMVALLTEVVQVLNESPFVPHVRLLIEAGHHEPPGEISIDLIAHFLTDVSLLHGHKQPSYRSIYVGQCCHCARASPLVDQGPRTLFPLNFWAANRGISGFGFNAWQTFSQRKVKGSLNEVPRTAKDRASAKLVYWLLTTALLEHMLSRPEA